MSYYSNWTIPQLEEFVQKYKAALQGNIDEKFRKQLVITLNDMENELSVRKKSEN